MLNNIVGTVSVGTGMQDLINKGVTRLSNMAENSLGHDLVTPLFRSGLELGLKLPAMFNNLYSTASNPGNPDLQASARGGLLNRQQTMSVGGSNLMPTRSRYANTTNLNYYNRGLDAHNHNECFHRACEKENELIENVKQMIIEGQNAIYSPTIPNENGDAANVCPATALITGKQMVDVGTHIKDIETTIAANFLLEQHQTHANVITAALTSSTPQIAIPPKTIDINAAVKGFTPEELDEVSECFRISGSKYGVLVADATHDFSPNLDAEFMQSITDSTLIPTSDGCRTSIISRVKKSLLNSYPTDDCTTEALCANPEDVSLLDLDLPQYYETDWLDVVQPIPNTFNTTGYPPGEPVNHIPIYGDIFTKTITSFSGGINPALDAYAHNNTFNMYSLTIDKSQKSICAYLPYNFAVMDAFVDYDVAFRFELNFSMIPNASQLTANKIVALNALMKSARVGLVTGDKDGGKSVYFLPISPYDNNNDTGTLSFEYSELTRSSILGTIVDIISAQIVPTDGFFTFAIVIPTESDTTLAFTTNWNLNVNMGTARLTRKETSQKISHWIFDGKISTKPFLRHFFMVFANDTQLNHPFDVTEFWKTVVIQRINPYIRSIVRILQQDNMSAIISAAWIRMQPLLIITTRENFRTWLLDTIIDMPNWMFWKANSTLMYVRKPIDIPYICFDIYKMARHILTLIPYDSQNTSTIASALANINEDPTFTKGDSIALKDARQRCENNMIQLRNRNKDKNLAMYLTSGL